MVLKHILLFLVICCGVLKQANGEDCVPNGAQIIWMLSNATLYWEMNPYPVERCNITMFEIDIFNDGDTQYHFEATDNYLDVSFLEVCGDLWSFTVTPISNGVIGFARTATEYIPLPSDADLTLSYFNATSVEGRDVLLQWDLANNTYGNCSLEYYVFIRDVELEMTKNVLVRDGNSYNEDTLAPCGAYGLSVRASNRALPYYQGSEFSIDLEVDPKPQFAPRLQSIDVQATSVNMTFTLEEYTNRCPLITLYVDGGTYFNESVPLDNLIDTASASIAINSLQPNSMYYCRVYVENSGGVSTPTQMAFQTLEL